MRWKFLFAVLLPFIFVAIPCLAQTPQNLPADRTIAVFGQTIHYWDVGSGPVLVLVHGLGDRKESWTPVIPTLSQKYRVLALDQIGFGKSAKPLLDYNIQTYVDFLNEFLRDLNVQKASLVGESLGGWIVGLYAVESSSDSRMVPLEKLVLMDAAGLKREGPVPDLNPSSLAQMRRVMELVYYDTSWLTDERLHQIFVDKLGEQDGYTTHALLTSSYRDAQSLDSRLSEIHVPTLVLWGRQDQLIPLANGERYAAGIAGAKLVTFDKCGHVPAAEHTAEFLAAIEQFLAK